MSGSNIKLLENFIDFCSVKNKVISKNIANVGTENYKREDVSFSDVLSQNINSSIKSSNSKHIKIVEPGFNQFPRSFSNEEYNASGINNVEIEKEMGELAKNTLNFKFASRKISAHFKSLQAVIKGGGQ